jgi:hypothetical protein
MLFYGEDFSLKMFGLKMIMINSESNARGEITFPIV